MSISASMVKDLRERTGAGMLDCKKALEENSGNFDAAIDWLRKKGISKAAKKADRVAAEGLVSAYIHGEGRIGVLLEVNSETDFVARNADFRQFVNDVAMHIAASNPICIREEDIPSAVRAKEREILVGRAREEGKPDAMLEKIVDGQMKKWAAQQVLLTQPFIKNPDKTVGDYLSDSIAKIGENLVIRRFVRFELGEGIEKRKDDFAAEVAAQLKG